VVEQAVANSRAAAVIRNPTELFIDTSRRKVTIYFSEIGIKADLFC